MEMASELWRLRTATSDDVGRLTRLLRHAYWAHFHADWRLPADWIGYPGFVLAEPVGAASLAGCLCIAPDPPPASWVRLAALRDTAKQFAVLRDLMEAALAAISGEAISEIALLGNDAKLESWLPTLGFRIVNEVITFVHNDLQAAAPPATSGSPVSVRRVRLDDLPRLVAIEEAAFDPIWRHSREGLALGWQHALSFHVAELGDAIAGFQYSARSDRPRAAHLVRLTVDPSFQRQGVGSTLLAAALASYFEQGYDAVSLNTQADNVASQRLYERFGLTLAGYPIPVWRRTL
jgi:ribosomal protein S18 acetylase RimI-like enzyme